MNCSLCPGGAILGNSTAILSDALFFGLAANATCASLSAGLSNFTNADDECRRLQLLARIPCGCEPIACDLANDTCPFQSNGVCHDNVAECVSPYADCLDCEPCRLLTATSCEACAASGCVWCPSSATCSSPFLLQAESIASCAADAWLSTCPTETGIPFNDPLYLADQWAFDMIHVQPIWQQGIYGEDIRIRVNAANGFDVNHIEFEGRVMDAASSCPPLVTNVTGKGTFGASLAAGAGNNSECSVGIAPLALLSTCQVYDSDNRFVPDFDFLTTALGDQDVSLNTYSVDGCFKNAPASGLGPQQRRRLQRCPFAADSTPCRVCGDDFSSDNCTTAVADYCRNSINYQNDPACARYLNDFAGCNFNSLPSAVVEKLELATTAGRDGKGVVLVFAVGDAYAYGSDTNFQGFQTTRLGISVAAVGQDGLHASYSTAGTGVFVSAPGGDADYPSNLFGAKRGGGCTDVGYGTAFAASILTGVIAMMLQVNPDLGYRDVQGILAATSTAVGDAADKTFTVNAAGYSHSNLYGFGIVNASAAVEATPTWTNFGPEELIESESGAVNIVIYDFGREFGGNFIESTIFVDQNIEIESVVLYVDVKHTTRGHLEMTLTSPSGTLSQLTPGYRDENQQLAFGQRWKLMTLRCWGEKSKGLWYLHIRDNKNGDKEDCVDLALISYDDDFRGVDIPGGDDNYPTCEYFYTLKGDGFCDDPEFATYDLAGDCCRCGGGGQASEIVDTLVSWKILIYGHDIGDGGLGEEVSAASVALETIQWCWELCLLAGLWLLSL